MYEVIVTECRNGEVAPWTSTGGGLQFCVNRSADTFELMVDGPDGKGIEIAIPFRVFAHTDLPAITALVQIELDRRGE